MKKLFTIVSMTLIIPALTSCGGGPKGDMPWIVDRFDDIKVIRLSGADVVRHRLVGKIIDAFEKNKAGIEKKPDQNKPPFHKGGNKNFRKK